MPLPLPAGARRFALLLDREDWDARVREQFRLRWQLTQTAGAQDALLGEIETAVMAMAVEADHAAGVDHAYGIPDREDA